MRAGERFIAHLDYGFNFVFLADDAGDQQRLFLLNWTRESHVDAVYVICIHPHFQLVSPQCELVFSRNGHDGDWCSRHYQKSEFQVACTDLSHGLPSSEDCFRFVVSDSVLGEEPGCFQVKATIFTS